MAGRHNIFTDPSPVHFLHANRSPPVPPYSTRHGWLTLANNDRLLQDIIEKHVWLNCVKRNHMVCNSLLDISTINHYRTTGRCSGPAHYDVSIRQAGRAAFVTSSSKIFLTQTFPRCGATCYILPSRAMTQLFNGVNFVYRSVEVYLTFCSYIRVLVRIQCFYNGGRY